jgi:hypothetical protein
MLKVLDGALPVDWEEQRGMMGVQSAAKRTRPVSEALHSIRKANGLGLNA